MSGSSWPGNPVPLTDHRKSLTREERSQWTQEAHRLLTDWQLRFPDTDQIRSWFADELIRDVVLVMTLNGTTPNGTTPAWP